MFVAIHDFLSLVRERGVELYDKVAEDLLIMISNDEFEEGGPSQAISSRLPCTVDDMPFVCLITLFMSLSNI